MAQGFFSISLKYLDRNGSGHFLMNVKSIKWIFFPYICQKFNKKSIFRTFFRVFGACKKHMISAQPTDAK